MKRKASVSESDRDLFRRVVADVNVLQQDTVVHKNSSKGRNNNSFRRFIFEKINHSHYFSDRLCPTLETRGKIRYLKPGIDQLELKRLRHSSYKPDIFLDLHGFTKRQAKLELGNLIMVCRRERLRCAHIVTGYGQLVLKNNTPIWLAQHPYIMAFHEAPRYLGGDAALLVLIQISD